MVESCDHGQIVGLLCRRDSEGTILENWVRRETGVVDIDAARIPVDSDEVVEESEEVVSDKVHEGYKGKNRFWYTHNRKNRSGPFNTDGRFPTNHVFIHGSHCEAIKNEKGTMNWDCEKGCPVGMVDEQSGTLESGYRPNRENHDPKDIRRVFSDDIEFGADTYDDKGGASRFFRQLWSIDELVLYLKEFVGSEDGVIWYDE